MKGQNNKLDEIYQEYLLEKKYNYFIDKLFKFVPIFLPAPSLALFIYFNSNLLAENTLQENSRIIGEWIIYALLTILAVYLLSNSRPIRYFLLEWCQLKRIVNLDTSKLSRKDIIRLLIAYSIFGISATLTMITNIIPDHYLIMMIYLLVFLVSFVVMSLLSNFISTKKGVKLVNYAQIRFDGWREIIDIIVLGTSFVFCVFGIIITIALFV